LAIVSLAAATAMDVVAQAALARKSGFQPGYDVVHLTPYAWCKEFAIGNTSIVA